MSELTFSQALLRKPKWLIIAGNISDNLAERRKLRAGIVESRDGSTHSGWPVERSLQYINAVFDDYVAYGELTAESIKGKTILEIGPGDNLGVALRFFAAGAERVVALDKYYSHRDLEQHKTIYRALRQTLPPEQQSRYDRAFTSGGQIDSLQGPVRYVSGTPVESADQIFAQASFDFIVSRAVVYEIHQTEKAFRAMDRLLRPQGVMIHSLYFQDWMFPQNRHHPLEFLTISDGVYRWMAGDSGKSGRRMIGDYRQIMKDLGYDATFHLTRVIGPRKKDFPPFTNALVKGIHYSDEHLALVQKIRPRLLDRFRKLPDTDLLLEDAFLTARKQRG